MRKGDLLQDSMFMALRPKPAPINFSNKASNFYSSEYRRSDADNILVQNPSDKGHLTQSMAKADIAIQPKLTGNFEMQKSAMHDALRTTASGASLSNLIS